MRIKVVGEIWAGSFPLQNTVHEAITLDDFFVIKSPEFSSQTFFIDKHMAQEFNSTEDSNQASNSSLISAIGLKPSRVEIIF